MITVGRILFVSGVVFGCGYALHRRRRQQERAEAEAHARAQARARAMEEAIAGVWSEPRPLIADVERSLRGPGQTAATIPATGRRLEVPLTPQAQRDCWAAAEYLAMEGQTENREGTIRRILQGSVAPAVDWSDGFAPYRGDLRFRDVYEATGDLLDLAELSHKYGTGTEGKDKGGLVCPGWVHERGAPSADVRPNDYVEVLVSEYSPDPADDIAHAEWAWVKVAAVPKNDNAVAGAITLEAPPGGQSHVLKHSSLHGFEPGQNLVVPRSCIFAVVKGR